MKNRMIVFVSTIALAAVTSQASPAWLDRDKDGDRKISQEEWLDYAKAEAKEKGEEPTTPAEVKKFEKKVLRQFKNRDIDGDGFVTGKDNKLRREARLKAKAAEAAADKE